MQAEVVLPWLLNLQLIFVKVTSSSLSITQNFLFFLLTINFHSFVMVVVHLRATGDAPILKQSNFKVWVLFILQFSY
jgi:hypothetical protein